MVETGCVSQLSRPGENVLIGTVDLGGMVRGSDGELGSGFPKTRLNHGGCNLFHHRGKNFIRWRETDVPLYLYFYRGGFAGQLMSVDDDIIERVPRRGSLETNSFDGAAG